MAALRKSLFGHGSRMVKAVRVSTVTSVRLSAETTLVLVFVWSIRPLIDGLDDSTALCNHLVIGLNLFRAVHLLSISASLVSMI
jgi:hypothetical protein